MAERKTSRRGSRKPKNVQLTVTAQRAENKMYLREVLATCDAGLPEPWRQLEVAVAGGLVMVTLSRKDGSWVVYGISSSELAERVLQLENLDHA